MKRIILISVVFVLACSSLLAKDYILYAKCSDYSYIIMTENDMTLSIKFNDENNIGKDLLDLFNKKANVIFPIDDRIRNDLNILFDNLAQHSSIEDFGLQNLIDYAPTIIKSDLVSKYSKELGFDISPFLNNIKKTRAYAFDLKNINKLTDTSKLHLSLWYEQVMALADRR